MTVFQGMSGSGIDDVERIENDTVFTGEDLGFEDAGGLRVLGRVAGAEPRGCSLAMDALLSQGESR